MPRKLIMLSLILCSMVFLGGCGQAARQLPVFQAPLEGSLQVEEPVTEKSVNLAFVGDVMAHSPQITAAKREGGGRSYNFNPVFEPVKQFLSSADYTIANLETPLAGEQLGFSGYPQFNAPQELAEGLFKAGVDAVTSANNHALDRGEQGIINTLNALKHIGLSSWGTARNVKEANKVNIKEVNGVSIGFLAYTYGTNGIPVPKGKAYLVNRIDEQLMLKEIATARQAGAEAVVVSVHFGHEYQRIPSQEQERLARLLIANGADVVVGSHPHVQQPMEWVEVKTEDGSRRGLIIYSLGNFFSNQRDQYTDTGMIVNVLLVRKGSAHPIVNVEQVSYLPTWVWRKGHPGNYTYRIIPANSPVMPASTAGTMPKKDVLRQEQAYQEVISLIPGTESDTSWIEVNAPTVTIEPE